MLKTKNRSLSEKIQKSQKSNKKKKEKKKKASKKRKKNIGWMDIKKPHGDIQYLTFLVVD